MSVADDDYDDIDDAESYPDDDPRDEEDRCEQCLFYGPVQCDVHGPDEIAWMRDEDEHMRLLEALEAIATLPDTAWRGEEHVDVVALAKVALASLRGDHG